MPVTSNRRGGCSTDVAGTGGFRVDGNSQFGKEVSPSWSVAIPLEQYGVTLRGSYSEGFRAPSFNELYFPGFGNPNLSPEISTEYDGGITKTFGERVEITANYFSRRVHSLIVAVPCTTCPRLHRRQTPVASIPRASNWFRRCTDTRAGASGSMTVPRRNPRLDFADTRPMRVPK